MNAISQLNQQVKAIRQKDQDIEAFAVLDDLGLVVLDDKVGQNAHHYRNISSIAKKFFKDSKPITISVEEQSRTCLLAEQGPYLTAIIKKNKVE